VDETIIDIQAGHNHSACLTIDGRLLTWGKNDIGQLGHSDTYMDVLYSQEEFPRHVDPLPLIKQVSVSKGRTAVVTEKGELYVWGAQFNHFPTLIDSTLFGNLKVIKAVCAGGMSGAAVFAITEDGALWSFGDVRSSLLGRQINSVSKVFGTVKNDATPQHIEFHVGHENENSVRLGKVLDVYAGFGNHAMAKIEVLNE
jgi:alpha-tubulin suppressor-like RCC1 family protein